MGRDVVSGGIVKKSNFVKAKIEFLFKFKNYAYMFGRLAIFIPKAKLVFIILRQTFIILPTLTQF